MKRLLFICFFSCAAITTSAQDTESRAVDKRILNMPASETNSTSSIASFIQSNYKTGIDKFRAIYRWVTYNIKYDTDSMYVFNSGGDAEMKVIAALRRRKGVCENYTALFNEIALKCNLRSFVVSGYTKQFGKVDKIGHTCCAVSINGAWLFCDPTWDEGYIDKPDYFLVSPAVFIESHMPFDPIWQLLDQRVSTQEFYQQNPKAGNSQLKYHSIDSVEAFLKLNKLQQLQASARRIRSDGIINSLGKNNLAYIDMEISLIYEDRDMNLYNSAAEDLNKANTVFNHFIEYRNKQFSPQSADGDLKDLLAPIDINIISAQKTLDQLDSSGMNEQYNTSDMRERLNNFKTKLQQQKDFLAKYLSTPLPEREKLFYH